MTSKSVQSGLHETHSQEHHHLVMVVVEMGIFFFGIEGKGVDGEQ